MFRLILAFALTLFVAIVKANNLQSLFGNGHDPKKIHAVLVSGVPYNTMQADLNYAPEAEIAQTYHLLRDNGVPADNIILFLNGGFADNEETNPWPGTLYTDKNRSRNYNEGLRIDYKGENVTSKNFLAVIRGEKDKVDGGSGRVLNSGKDDRVFISHESHGGTGVLGFNQDTLTVKDLHKAFKEMNKKKMFKELTYYVMACLSGSMFAGHLDKNGNIYAVTAANPKESAWPKENITKDDVSIWINTEFGNAWLIDTLKHDSDKETLKQQYNDVKALVHESHVSHYGNLKIGNDKVSDFEGETKHSSIQTVDIPTSNYERSVPIAPIASYLLLKKKLEKATSFAERKELNEKLREMEQEQKFIVDGAHAIVQSLLGPKFSSPLVMSQFDESPDMITNLDCHDDVVKSFENQCHGTRKSIFFNQFLVPMVNLCEQGYESKRIIAEMHKYCLE